MKSFRVVTALLLCLAAPVAAFASAYNGSPKLVVIIIIDQFRGDYLARAHDQFVPGGFRLFTDRGAWFTNCNYAYANNETGPGHATLLTGSYSDGHGILSNDWWDAAAKRMLPVATDLDPNIKLLDGAGPGFSPRVLMSDTLGDELKLATDNRSRVFAISLKPRSSVLSGGYTANGAYWINPANGQWQTSTYYMQALPEWVAKLNASGATDKYWNQEWKSPSGQVMGRTTRPSQPGKSDFYDIVGATPLGNDWELAFARQLIENEKLGQGPTTDLLVISLSATDLLGHAVGPNAAPLQAMVTVTDGQLADFFNYLGHRFGLAKVWLALSADHGVAPAPEYAAPMRLPAAALNNRQLALDVNTALNARFSKGKNTPFLRSASMTHLMLNDDSFAAVKVTEAEAERAACEAALATGIMRRCYTKSQLAAGQVAPDAEGRQYLHSYSPYGGWWVVLQAPPFQMGLWPGGATTHGTAYYYDTHVPLAFYGVPFPPGVYRGRCEPVDMVATLASLLGINAPARAQGRVLTEAARPSSTETAP
jgi:hypothetical protein